MRPDYLFRKLIHYEENPRQATGSLGRCLEACGRDKWRSARYPEEHLDRAVCHEHLLLSAGSAILQLRPKHA